MTKNRNKLLSELVACGRQFYERRWMWGTAGNLSVKLKNNPLEIAITPSGLNKGHLKVSDLLIVRSPNSLLTPVILAKAGIQIHKSPWTSVSAGVTTARRARDLAPSAETAIHQTIHRTLPSCGAVFHVHPIYATLISSLYGHPKERRMLKIEWFEMMKGVGVGEAESAEVVILPNWQDVSLIARDVKNYLETSAKPLPAVLIYNHGLTVWGSTPDQARNHLEIMEYVCQYLYLKQLIKH